MGKSKPEGGGVTRLSFLKASAGAAAGAAAVAIPAAVVADQQPGVVTDPSSPNPPEPVMAYVRDARRGEVTVMQGTNETTYRDRALVKRLLDAAPEAASTSGGGLDVLAP
jgi:hypothetical protein